jgi:hypothetical protein
MDTQAVTVTMTNTPMKPITGILLTTETNMVAQKKTIPMRKKATDTTEGLNIFKMHLN